MDAKEWFEQSGYEYKLDKYDEGGYIGIDENKVAEMLDVYHEGNLTVLLSKATQMKLEQQHRIDSYSQYYNQYELGTLNGIDRIVKLIERHTI